MGNPPVVSFVAHGIPAPQGSKNQFGGESNPRTRPWRAAVAAEGGLAMQALGLPPKTGLLEGPLRLTVLFYFPRLKAHFRSNGDVKDTAPTYKTSYPDTDKLIRAIGDALTGIVYHDDAQIAEVRAAKLYDATARAEVTIEPAATVGVWTL